MAQESTVQQEPPVEVEKRRNRRTVKKIVEGIASPPAPPSRVSEDDRAYMARLAADAQRRDQMLRQAQALIKGAQDIAAAYNSWMGYLMEKYRMQEGDRIEDDGAITRVAR